eukprot:28196_1
MVSKLANMFFFILASIAMGICLPTMLYWFCKAYQYRHQSFIRSRHPKLLFFNCFISCLCIIERVIALSYDLNIFRMIYHKDLIIRNVIYVSIFGLYIHLYLLRHWLLFYDLGYREAQVNILWERELNILALTQSRWFIDHRENLGNVRFMMFFVFCLFLIIVICLFILHWFHSQFLWSIGLSIYGIILSLIFVLISYKISTINKSLKMKNQIFYVGCMLFIGAIIYSIIISFNISSQNIIIITFCISTLIPFVLSLMSTFYHIKKSHKKSSNISTVANAYASSDDYWNKLPQKKLTLRDLLKNVNGFKLFIRHLIKDLCVENLIYLSYVISFKKSYDFLIQKELEDKKTRSGIIEEDEHEIGIDDDPHEYIEEEDSDHDEIEYKLLYGWNLLLPNFDINGQNSNTKPNINISIGNINNNQQLLLQMYEESLLIYKRFIKVQSKDEINISGKMRKSLKKYFEIEQIIEKTQNGLLPNITTTLQNVTNSMQTQLKSKNSNSKLGVIKKSKNKRNNSHTDSLNAFPNLPGQLTGSKTSNYSNDSMNIRLTEDCTDDIDDSPLPNPDDSPLPNIDIDNIHNIDNNNEIDIVLDDNTNMNIQLDEKPKTKPIIKRTSGIGRVHNRISSKFNTKRTRKEKTRFMIAIQPNDNYLKLDWIQRFKIFDKSCDSIEKLLRIDSYGKFRESPEYLMFCDQIRKKSMSKSTIFSKVTNRRKTSSL